MKKIMLLLAFLSGCSSFHLEQDLKHLTGMIHVTYLCVEDTEKPIPAQWNQETDCIELNMEEMQWIADQYGEDAVKGIWLHELARYKKEEPVSFVDLQMKKYRIDPAEYRRYQNRNE